MEGRDEEIERRQESGRVTLVPDIWQSLWHGDEHREWRIDGQRAEREFDLDVMYFVGFRHAHDALEGGIGTI